MDIFLNTHHKYNEEKCIGEKNSFNNVTTPSVTKFKKFPPICNKWSRKRSRTLTHFVSTQLVTMNSRLILCQYYMSISSVEQNSSVQIINKDTTITIWYKAEIWYSFYLQNVEVRMILPPATVYIDLCKSLSSQEVKQECIPSWAEELSASFIYVSSRTISWSFLFCIWNFVQFEQRNNLRNLQFQLRTLCYPQLKWSAELCMQGISGDQGFSRACVNRMPWQDGSKKNKPCGDTSGCVASALYLDDAFRDLRPEDRFQPEHARFSDACPTAGREMTSRRQYVTNPFPKTW